MKKNNKQPRINYDVESDVLRVELSQQPTDYATEMGNVVVHFNPNGLPVYFEILEAKKFLLQSEKILKRAGIPEFARA